MKRILVPLFCALIPATSAAASEAARNVPSAIPGAPDHLVPMSASQVADERMREIIASKLAETLDIGGADDGDLQRLIELANAANEDAGEAGGASRIAEAAFDPTATEAPSDAIELAEAGNPLHGMSAEQIQAVALLMAAMQDPAALHRAAGLDVRSPQVDQRPQQAREVTLDATNGGASVLLAGWSVAMRSDGSTRLFRDDSPGSEIPLEAGMVIGALGPVTDIRRIGSEVYVSFENGDSLSGPADAMAAGIPPLPPISNTDFADDFVMLSQPAEVASRSASAAAPLTPIGFEASGEVKALTQLSPATRPMARPASLQSR